MSDYMKIGVDEAGRGPAIGPLVVCAFGSVSTSNLIELGVKDSKDLTRKRREQLFEDLSKMPHSVVICQPERIDNSGNLNELEVELFAESLQTMPMGDVMLDACDIDSERFARNVTKLSNRYCKAEHKADQKYPEVGAASIIAKVIRDRIIEELSEDLGIDLGSGYPSDSKTRNAVKLLVNGKLPHSCLRWSWKTVKDAWGGETPPRPSASQQTLF